MPDSYQHDKLNARQALRDYCDGSSDSLDRAQAWMLLGMFDRLTRIELEFDLATARIEELAASVGIRIEAH